MKIPKRFIVSAGGYKSTPRGSIYNLTSINLAKSTDVEIEYTTTCVSTNIKAKLSFKLARLEECIKDGGIIPF